MILAIQADHSLAGGLVMGGFRDVVEQATGW
jgi:hypothetical protein